MPLPPASPHQLSLFRTIKPGSRVTILVPNGIRLNWETRKTETEWREKTGRAVFKGTDTQSWALNMGGRHGTPGVCTPENLTAVDGTTLLSLAGIDLTKG